MNISTYAGALLLALAPTVAAQAQVAPNPGGSVVVTNSTTASPSYVDTPVTQEVDDYATSISAILNGSTVFTQSFTAPFSDPTVQQAVASADAILTGDGASFAAPSLANNTKLLQSSVTTTASPPTLSCGQILSGYSFTGESSTTVTTTFGPATIGVGLCRDESFFVYQGQEDLDVNVEGFYAVPVDVVTTSTYLTTQSYAIVGTAASSAPAPGSVPEPSSLVLLLVGCGTLFGVLRVRA